MVCCRMTVMVCCHPDLTIMMCCRRDACVGAHQGAATHRHGPETDRHRHSHEREHQQAGSVKGKCPPDSDQALQGKTCWFGGGNIVTVVFILYQM